LLHEYFPATAVYCAIYIYIFIYSLLRGILSSEYSFAFWYCGKYNLNDRVKEHDLGRACNRHKRHKMSGKSEVKIPLGNPKRWLDNIKKDFRIG
jgi:hypothetical protein